MNTINGPKHASVACSATSSTFASKSGCNSQSHTQWAKCMTSQSLHRKEAAKDAAQEPILSSFLYASVLSHDSFEMALAAILANRLSDPTMMATELIDIFHR